MGKKDKDKDYEPSKLMMYAFIAICVISVLKLFHNDDKTLDMPSAKAVKKFEKIENFENDIKPKNGYWLTYYYMEQNPDGVIAEIQELNDKDKFEYGVETTNTILLLSNIFMHHPDKIDYIINRLNLSEKGNRLVISALAKADKRRKAAEYGTKCGWSEAKLKLISKIPSIYIERTIESRMIVVPKQINELLAAFLASADNKYLLRIAKTLDEPNIAANAAARNAFSENVRKHELIRKIAIKESKNENLSKKTRDFLEYVSSAPTDNFPDHDGTFGATLAAISPDYGEEWNKKSDTTSVQINGKHSLKKGDVTELAVFFIGMDLKDDLTANVTYDIKIIKPDGSIASEDTNLTALNAKIPTPFAVYRPNEAIKYAYGNNDVAGTYTVQATIHDNVSGKSLNLETEFDLLP
jgi:hypothetical protein